MRKTFASSGVLVMGVLVALAALGVVYGLWSKNLVINGTVTTGDLNADWDCGWTNDDGVAAVISGGGCPDNVTEPTGDTGADPNEHDWPNFTDSSPFIRKDVGECKLAIGDRATAGGFGNQVAYVTITNGYPSYECTVTLLLTNTGSIPFNISGARLALEAAAVGKIETVDAAGNDQCNVGVNETIQVDPGEELRFRCTVHVTELAAQNVCTGVTTVVNGVVAVAETCTPPLTTYSFAINVCVAQWNEAATFAECKASDQHDGPDEVVFQKDSDGDGSLDVVVDSAALNYGDGGWGGWSCPAGLQSISATIDATNPIVGQQATPNSVWPHYTYGPAEWGWVAQDSPDGLNNPGVVIHVTCS